MDRCINCVYFAISGKGIDFQGRCRRYAPRPDFAETTLAGWCGEHIPGAVGDMLAIAEKQIGLSASDEGKLRELFENPEGA